MPSDVLNPLSDPPAADPSGAVAPLPSLPPADFRLTSDFAPAGDQPQAIVQLTEGLMRGERDQVLLGVTGSGKTFTIAHGHRRGTAARR